ncbi:hypothetical protein HanIR_Chr11g0513621 [Helianthus annuus]|nr:hypothetical protein HanIR_Chr11g0513621 [Helianthus annuus]
MTCLNAAPNPSQTGRWNLVWVHAKIHGMARSDSMPPLGFRFDGRLPIFIRPYSISGVACRITKKCVGVNLFLSMVRTRCKVRVVSH